MNTGSSNTTVGTNDVADNNVENPVDVDVDHVVVDVDVEETKKKRRLTSKLNDHIPSVCESVFYAGLKDGNHTFEVCTKGIHGVGCSSYTWIVG